MPGGRGLLATDLGFVETDLGSPSSSIAGATTDRPRTSNPTLVRSVNPRITTHVG